jgi:hypothetical protein
MPDNQTLQDHNEDLILENRQLRQQLQRWERIARAAFKQAGGTCITGCRGACMCTCGFEHFRYETRHEQTNG